MNRALAFLLFLSLLPFVTGEQAPARSARNDAKQQLRAHVQDPVQPQQKDEQTKQEPRSRPTPVPLPTPSLSIGNSEEQKPLSLSDALKLAIENNKEMEIARSGVLMAEIERDRVMKNAHGDAGRRALEVARQSLEAADAKFRLVVLDTIAKVQYAYWELVLAKKDMMVKLANLNDTRQIKTTNDLLVSMGRMSPLDFVVVEAEVANLQQVFLDTTENLIQSENTLKYLIMVDKDDAMWNVNLVPTETIDGYLTQEISLPDTLKAALENNPELKLQRIAEKINEIDQRYYKREGEEGYNYRKSLLEGERLKAERQRLELRVQMDVRNAIQKLNNAKYRLSSARTARASIEQILARENKAFFTGETSTREILTSQSRLRDARYLEVRAESDVAKILAQVQRLTGLTLRG